MDFRPISASLMNESALLNWLKTFHLSLPDLFVLLSPMLALGGKSCG